MYMYFENDPFAVPKFFKRLEQKKGSNIFILLVLLVLLISGYLLFSLEGNYWNWLLVLGGTVLIVVTITTLYIMFAPTKKRLKNKH